MKTIQLVGVQSCQIFVCSKGAPQKMQIFGAIKPAGKSRPVAPNKTQNGEKSSHRIDRHRPKIFLNPNYRAHIPTALEQGQICIRGIMGKLSPGKKFLRF